MDLDAGNSGQIWQSRKLHLITQPFALAVSNSAIPTVIADLTLEDTPIVFVNASLLDLTGWTEDELLGRNLRVLHDSRTDPATAARMEDAVRDHEQISADVRLARRNGSGFWARVDIAPMFGPDGRAASLVATIVDVSDRVRATRGLRNAEERFEQRVEERTAALADALERTQLMSREITHRTKNALAILGALIETKRRRARDAQEDLLLREISDRLRAVGRLQGLLDGVESETNGIDLAIFLQELARELDASSEPHVLLHEAPHAFLPPGTALPVALCVTELVLNAQKHSFCRGTEGTIELKAWREDETIRLTVSDNGNGLPEGFDPSRSTGLGMFVVLDQCAKIGGRLDCGPSDAGGARFEISFPG